MGAGGSVDRTPPWFMPGTKVSIFLPKVRGLPAALSGIAHSSFLVKVIKHLQSPHKALMTIVYDQAAAAAPQLPTSPPLTSGLTFALLLHSVLLLHSIDLSCCCFLSCCCTLQICLAAALSKSVLLLHFTDLSCCCCTLPTGRQTCSPSTFWLQRMRQCR